MDQGSFIPVADFSIQWISTLRDIIHFYLKHYFCLRFFLHQPYWMVYHWGLRDSKSPHEFRTLISLLADLSNAVVWMVSARPLVSKLASSYNCPLVTLASSPITTDIIVTFMFNSFFQSPSKVQVLILLFVFFRFQSVVNRDIKVHNSSSSLFFLNYYLVAQVLLQF